MVLMKIVGVFLVWTKNRKKLSLFFSTFIFLGNEQWKVRNFNFEPKSFELVAQKQHEIQKIWTKLNNFLQEFCDSGTKMSVFRLVFKSLLGQNDQVALFLCKHFQSNFALQHFFKNVCCLLNYKFIIKGDFSVSFGFPRKKHAFRKLSAAKKQETKKVLRR